MENNEIKNFKENIDKILKDFNKYSILFLDKITNDKWNNENKIDDEKFIKKNFEILKLRKEKMIIFLKNNDFLFKFWDLIKDKELKDFDLFYQNFENLKIMGMKDYKNLIFDFFYLVISTKNFNNIDIKLNDKKNNEFLPFENSKDLLPLIFNSQEFRNLIPNNKFLNPEIQEKQKNMLFLNYYNNFIFKELYSLFDKFRVAYIYHLNKKRLLKIIKNRYNKNYNDEKTSLIKNNFDFFFYKTKFEWSKTYKIEIKKNKEFNWEKNGGNKINSNKIFFHIQRLRNILEHKKSISSFFDDYLNKSTIQNENITYLMLLLIEYINLLNDNFLPELKEYENI